MSIEWLINKITGRGFNYWVVCRYYPDVSRGEIYTENTSGIVIYSRHSGIYREIKKEVAKSLIPAVPKCNLNNGKIVIKSIDYVGWF